MMIRKWPIVIVLIVGVAFGYGQEYLKIAINFASEYATYGDWDGLESAARVDQLEQCRLNRPSDYYHNHRPLLFLSQLGNNQISILKWSLAFIFILFYWGLARWGLIKAFTKEFPLKILDIGSVLMGVICVGVFGAGKVLGLTPAYDVAREILGALQSLIPFVVLVLGYSLYLRLNN